MCQNGKVILQLYEAFLKEIPLETYRKELMSVKTVEQDLPRALNPLSALYAKYWFDVDTPASDVQFLGYEDFFKEWWESHQTDIEEFRTKYFWGCTCEFVRLGFKARLYRTFISVLTQFHFCYSWRAYCEAPVVASADLDMKGIDACVHFRDKQVGLQVKKVTYRREAAGEGRFARRGLTVDYVVEVPYTIEKAEDCQSKKLKARSADTRRRYELFEWLASALQRRLDNGFVVFSRDYPRSIETLLAKIAMGDSMEQRYCAWQETMKLIRELKAT